MHCDYVHSAICSHTFQKHQTDAATTAAAAHIIIIIDIDLVNAVYFISCMFSQIFRIFFIVKTNLLYLSPLHRLPRPNEFRKVWNRLHAILHGLDY